MEFITPELNAPIITLAKDQPEYRPIQAALVFNTNYPLAALVQDGGFQANTLVTAFRLSPEERQRIADGADVYIAMLTFGNPMQPILPCIGKEAMASTMGIKPL